MDLHASSAGSPPIKQSSALPMVSRCILCRDNTRTVPTCASLRQGGPRFSANLLGRLLEIRGPRGLARALRGPSRCSHSVRLGLTRAFCFVRLPQSARTVSVKAARSISPTVAVSAQPKPKAIEDEVMLTEAPESLLRGDEDRGT